MRDELHRAVITLNEGWNLVDGAQSHDYDDQRRLLSVITYFINPTFKVRVRLIMRVYISAH